MTVTIQPFPTPNSQPPRPARQYTKRVRDLVEQRRSFLADLLLVDVLVQLKVQPVKTWRTQQAALLRLVSTLLLVVLLPASLGSQALVTGVRFIGIEQVTYRDWPPVFYGLNGGAMAGIMNIKYDIPFTCRCGTKAKPSRVRLLFEGKGGVYVTLSDEATNRLIENQMIQIPQSGRVMAAWDIDGAVVFHFGPGTNMRAAYVDAGDPVPGEPVPVLELTPPNNLRIVR